MRWKLKPLYFIETILNRIQIKLYQNPVYRKTRYIYIYIIYIFNPFPPYSTMHNRVADAHYIYELSE